jgi:hypothetical protein
VHCFNHLPDHDYFAVLLTGSRASSDVAVSP